MDGVKIGKKLILALTSGMYEDSRFIYREYIQNSADQIDIAISEKLINETEASIVIFIDKEKRNIIIHDNATGIKTAEVAKQLGNVGDSEKSGEETMGFIGIGRLGGLAYCSELIFSTSYKGERIKTIMKWDSDNLHKLIDDSSINDDAASVIEKSITIETEEEDEDKHYFQVEMISVKETNDELLDVKSVREYLSMVAPIPYDNVFTYRNKITKQVQENNYPALKEYRVLLNEEQLFKPYRKNIYKQRARNRVVVDEIHDLAFEEFRTDNGEVLGWLWYGISRFDSQINRVGNLQRGLRLRCKNIQIGDDSTVVSKKFFKEDRGNYYFIGEVHTIHPEIRPNARRDYYVDNTYLRDLEIKLRAFCSDRLHNLYYNANVVKTTLKKEVEYKELSKKYEEKKLTGFTSKSEERKLQEALENTKESLDKKRRAKATVENKAIEYSSLKSSIKAIKKRYNIEENEVDGDDADIVSEKRVLYSANKLSKLKKGERRVVKRIFEIIDSVLTPELAEELTCKIMKEFQK